MRLGHGLVRERILDVAADVFQAGYHSSSLDEIATRLNITKPTLYHYFPSKGDLLCALYDRVVMLALQRMKSLHRARLPAPEKLEAMLRAHVELIADQLPLFTIFFQEKRSLPARCYRRVRPKKRAYTRMFRDVYRRGVETGVFRPLDAAIVANALLGMGSWLYQWYHPEGRLSPAEIAEVMVTLALRGCLRGRSGATSARPVAAAGARSRPRPGRPVGRAALALPHAAHP